MTFFGSTLPVQPLCLHIIPRARDIRHPTPALFTSISVSPSFSCSAAFYFTLSFAALFRYSPSSFHPCLCCPSRKVSVVVHSFSSYVYYIPGCIILYLCPPCISTSKRYIMGLLYLHLHKTLHSDQREKARTIIAWFSNGPDYPVIYF